MIDKNYYIVPQKNDWQGRIDGHEYHQMRWHQIIQTVDLTQTVAKQIFANSFSFLGFACDEGVRRNAGRVGAAEGSKLLRNACAKLPLHLNEATKLIDAGDVACINNDVEKTQEQLSNAVSFLLSQKTFPILFGGGHEIVYGHYNGIKKTFPDKKIGIVNFDAHFDLRKPEANGATSGTGFYQIAEDCKKDNSAFNYCAIGIQPTGNTLELFDRADSLSVDYVLAKDIHYFNLSEIKNGLQIFIDRVDLIYLTIDTDVFASAYAPGVSAINGSGISYDFCCKEILKFLIESGKMISLDVAEFNPTYDIDNRTVRLLAEMIFDITLMLEKINFSL